MKRSLYAIITAAIALSVTSISCGGDTGSGGEPGPVDNKKKELILSTAVEAQVRAAFTATDTQIPTGRTVAVWVHEATANAPQLYGKNILTANGSGGLSGGTTMYFPQNDSNVDIFALHTNAIWSGNEYPLSTLTHTVNSDQKNLANYASSDLLYAKAASVARTANTVPLTFYHLLSKLQVAVVPGNGLTASDIQSITVGATKLQASFTLNKATTPTAMVVSPSGTVSPITIGTDLSSNFTSPQYNDVIIVPQTLLAGTPFITIRITGGIDLAYLLTENTTFESKKKYIYHITVNHTELKVTTSIENWVPGGIVSGEASHLVN